MVDKNTEVLFGKGVWYEMFAANNGYRPEVFYCDGRHRDEIVAELKARLAKVPVGSQETADILNGYAKEEPEIRFANFKVADYDIDAGTTTLTGTVRNGNTPITMVLHVERQSS